MLATARGAVALATEEERTLVVVFLRGGADGLALVPAVGDDAYHRARPRLRVPIDGAAASRLDDLFALHPRLAPLHALYASGMMAVVHAVGSEDTTRSHFEAQDLMEHGGVTGGGWLGRFLRFRPASGSRALAAIAFGTRFPEVLRGAPAATVLRSLDDFSLGAGGAALARSLDGLYQREGGILTAAARDTVRALGKLEAIRGTPYRASGGATYASDELSQSLRQVAQLIKARVGLEAVSIDVNGWDSHFTQGTIIEPLMTQVAGALVAFHDDLGDAMGRTTVVVMTEFGRRVAENASLGTDHGRGSVMFVLGGGVDGGRVLGRWPGLGSDVLEGPGDVAVTTNFRDVLVPVLRRHGANDATVLGRIFPGHTVDALLL
ncbi:MAG: DUF1501 domain-containing protein [Gemmatimonadaceae bacterium]